MEMVKEMDAGDMIASDKYHREDRDNVGTLFEKLLGRVTSRACQITYQVPHHPFRMKRPSPFRPNIKPEERLDWNKSALLALQP